MIGIRKASGAAGTSRSRRMTIVLAAATCLLAPAIAIACSVPVFRFALEQWRPDAYQVFVYHNDDLNDEQTRLLERLKQQGSVSGANVQVQAIDVRGELAAADRQRLNAVGEDPLPQMVVNLPRGAGGGEVTVGTAAWNEQEVDRLIGSPARSDLAQRLIDGEVVWVFLGGGDQKQDDARQTALETELAGLQETLELPAIEPDDLKEISVAPDSLQIRFSSLRVDRNDPAEKWFTEMLLSVEPDLRDEEIAGEPMVFPVFGRGRALYALVGLGINADMIKEAAEFLTGPCQCTVKVENPGVDLLLPVRWDDYVVPTEPDDVSLPLVGLGGYQKDAQSDLPILAAKSSPTELPYQAKADLPREPSTSSVMAGALGQVDIAAERSTLAPWLPWIVMILLAVIVVIASLGFFRRY
jgi:hypothetical protein